MILPTNAVISLFKPTSILNHTNQHFYLYLNSNSNKGNMIKACMIPPPGSNGNGNGIRMCQFRYHNAMPANFMGKKMPLTSKTYFNINQEGSNTIFILKENNRIKFKIPTNAVQKILEIREEGQITKKPKHLGVRNGGVKKKSRRARSKK